MKNANTKAPAKAQKIKLEWDFSDLYSGLNDPAIEQDTKKLEALYEGFSKKYKNSESILSDDAKLLASLKDYAKLSEDSEGIRPLFYLNHAKDIDTSNTKMIARATQITERLTKASNQILFYELWLAGLSKERQAALLKNPAFADYSYFLEKIFAKAKYRLSESEEKILSLGHEASYKMWVEAQKKLASSKTFKFKGKELTLNQAFIMRKELPLKDRHMLHDMLAEEFKKIAFMSEAELNAIIHAKKVEDELRGAKKPYEITVAEYENDLATVESLAKAVSDNFSVTHKFYKAKAEIMGLQKLRMPDLAVTLSLKKKKVGFDEALTLVSEAFKKAHPAFSDFLHEMASEGRIDVYPRKGKRGGAYCTSTSKSLPIYILMNYDDTMDGVSTLAHEMGHAIHSKHAFEQPSLYADYTISVAEVASTFFEHVVFDHMLETMSEKDKAIALMNSIDDNIGVIFRQIQFFNFENELHASIKEKGSLSKEEMAALYVKHAKIANGPAVTVLESDGYYFTNVPHFRYFFYTYSYAYGQIISKALFAEYKKDHSFIEKVRDFMRAGGSKSPYQIFKSIGIDTSKHEFFEKGIAQVREELDYAISLAKKAGLMGKPAKSKDGKR